MNRIKLIGAWIKRNRFLASFLSFAIDWGLIAILHPYYQKSDIVSYILCILGFGLVILFFLILHYADEVYWHHDRKGRGDDYSHN